MSNWRPLAKYVLCTINVLCIVCVCVCVWGGGVVGYVLWMYYISHVVIVVQPNNVSCVISLSSTKPLPCSHGIVECPSNAHFWITPELVGHLEILCLLFYEFYEFRCKKNIILCIWCSSLCLFGLRLLKKHYFPHTVHYCCSSMSLFFETRKFLQSS